MKVVFMGTSEFAVPALYSIYNSQHKILAVFTKPPAKAFRGYHLRKSPINEASESLGLTVHCPHSLKDEDTLNILRSLQADIIVVAAYGHILRPTVLNMYKYGCINIHPSLLPRWRGAAPIERTILAGDTDTALCIIQMDIGLDTGDILLSQHVQLTGKETSANLTKTMGELGGKMVVKALNNYLELNLKKTIHRGHYLRT
jgi:methionyl-tRNA formyltransferase